MRQLTGVSILFDTLGDNKEDGTVIHVFVTNRSNTTATPDRNGEFVAHLLDEQRYESGGDLLDENRTPYLAFGLGLGAGMTFNKSEPPAHFPLSLGTFDLDMDDVVLPAVAIHIQPDGDDRWMFEYTVTFFFTEPNGIPKEVHFNSSRDGLAGIILDQDNRTHYGILAEPRSAPAAPHPDTDAVLDRVTLEFATHHDDKKADTKLNVHIVNRISASNVQDIAIGRFVNK